MKPLLYFTSILLAFVIASCKTSQLPQETKNEYLYKVHKTAKLDLPYRLMYPSKIQKKYPLLIFLHGSGERGTDNEKQLVHGSKWIQKNLADYPAIAIFPQCPTNDYWSNVTITTNAQGQRKFEFTEEAKATPAMTALMSLIEEMSQKPYIDPSRIYVMGLSMGGMATIELMWRMPGKFAAAAPICGGGTPSRSKAMAETKAIWLFHGDKDSVVPVDHSRALNKELSKFSKNVKYTEYPGLDHNSWDNVFAEPDFFKWMFAQKK